MAEPWVLLSEDDYPCPVLPPARAAGSVLDAYFVHELEGPGKEKQGEGRPVVVQEEAGGEAVTGSLSLVVVFLPLVLPLVVYLGATNQFIEARQGLLVEGILDLDDDITPPVRDPAHEGRQLRTLDGDFEEELSWMSGNTPGSPPFSAKTSDMSPPPKYKEMRELPEVAWPVDWKGGNATLGPRPLDEDEDLPIKHNLPFKKMKREGPTTVRAYLAPQTVGPAPFEGLPELREFTRRSKRHGGKTPSTRIPIMREPHEE
ncbi:hypothetical protein HPB49_020223 [Dermacentor silvarum]|uniref:Uncharacterized protein n=1 Tax=Dermacentor silvarum TaxID=543639 RepID=A0ACB8DFM7_DERSI|nr:hypothetical protein HPB49_020223 [Dermacentor silvarum]